METLALDSVKVLSKTKAFYDLMPSLMPSAKIQWNSFTMIETMVLISKDKNLLKETEKLLQSIKWLKSHLPTKAITSNDVKYINNISHSINEVLIGIENYLNLMNEIKISGENVIIDEKIPSSLNNSFNLLKEELSFISDYYNISIQVYKSRKELSSQKDTYTYDELEKVLLSI